MPVNKDKCHYHAPTDTWVDPNSDAGKLIEDYEFNKFDKAVRQADAEWKKRENRDVPHRQS